MKIIFLKDKKGMHKINFKKNLKYNALIQKKEY